MATTTKMHLGRGKDSTCCTRNSTFSCHEAIILETCVKKDNQKVLKLARGHVFQELFFLVFPAFHAADPTCCGHSQSRSSTARLAFCSPLSKVIYKSSLCIRVERFCGGSNDFLLFVFYCLTWTRLHVWQEL
jgi:hypothetical protein